MGRSHLDIDPRGVIHEAFRIDGITETECRTIFLDWAMFAPDTPPVTQMLETFMQVYGADHPDHPMTAVIAEGLEQQDTGGARRGGRAARRRS